MIYRQQQIVRKLPPCDFKLADLKSLVDICLLLHEDCKSKFQEDIQSKRFYVKNVDPADQNTIRNLIDGSFHCVIEINGDDGKYLNIRDINTLKNVELPHKITRVAIGNHSAYEIVNSAKPSVYFDVTIDFNTVRVFDLITSASRSTDDRSFIDVTGTHSVTVLGIASELDAFFKKHKNFRNLINAQNAYDIFLWFVFLPLFLYFLYQYHDIVPTKILNSPLPLQIAFSITVFFQTLLMFRFLFNAARWFFPCQELTTQTSKGKNIAKYIFSAAITGVIGSIVYNFFRWLSESFL